MSVRVVTATAPVKLPWIERVRGVLTPLNLHIAGAVVLGVVNLYLLIHLGVVWGQTNSQNEAAMTEERAKLHGAQVAAKPLEGLDGKLATSTEEADKFYQDRLPYAYSRVVEELGALAKKDNVKLARVQYGFAPVVGDPSLTEAKLDASLSGDYRPLVEFVNALERDRMFFLITGVTLTGQQSGTVNLRLKMIVYKRAAHGTEQADGPLVPAATDESAAQGENGGPA